VIAPKFKEMSEKDLDVVFLKLDCNQDNRVGFDYLAIPSVGTFLVLHEICHADLLGAFYLQPLAKELGIRVVPTFKIFKDGKVVKEITGAKIDELVQAIETVKSI
jgi:thioredoxin 1